MKFPHSMLLDFVETSLDAQQVGDLLTMAGFELEGIEDGPDPVLDIKVMSNRGDGLSVFGLAREVLAKDAKANPTDLYRRAAARFEPNQQPDGQTLAPDAATIESQGCRRFALRAFENIDGQASAPEWIRQRLALAGMRPISLLVDLTNYVMLELGQPLHAFDRDKLREGRIVVRHARPGEKLTTLNGQEHELKGQMMICDADRPVGVPGVMGGLETEVTDTTTHVLLESANFVNTTVRKTRKELGLATEASYRFERSVDPDGVVAAILRFSELLAAASPSARMSNIVDHYPGREARTPIDIRVPRTNELLGMEIPTSQAAEHLSRLGMEVAVEGDTLRVTPPSWRPDIVREEDLVEEIGRVHGYDQIPEVLPQGTTTPGGPQGFELWTDQLREAVVRAGFVQTISHSLRDAHPLDEATDRIGPRNPGSPDTALLRNSLLPSLADAARRNGVRDLHLFEIGKTFNAHTEELRLAILASGSVTPAHWGSSAAADEGFFTMKGALESALSAVGVSVTLAASSDPRLHPTRQAAIMAGVWAIGVLGQIHPEAATKTDLVEATVLCEVTLPAAYEARARELVPSAVSRFPAVRRDISIQIEKQVPYERIAAAIASATNDVLERQWLFDIYEGKGIPEGSHSLAIAMQLRKPDGTFTDEEANRVRDAALEALAGLGATRR